MTIEQFLLKKQRRYLRRCGISIVSVDSVPSGIKLAKDFIEEIVDRRTALFLSGGKTPVTLYEMLAKEEKCIPGIVGMIDERFGQKLHKDSNELMIKQTGFLSYLQRRDVNFQPILSDEKDIAKSTDIYDQFLRSTCSLYQHMVGVVGIGADGHTAGIAPDRSDFHNPLFDHVKDFLYVDWFDDANGYFKKRITLTFLGLSMLDYYILLVFGDEKRQALNLMFQDGSEEDIPARFYKRAEVAKKTILITDIDTDL